MKEFDIDSDMSKSESDIVNIIFLMNRVEVRDLWEVVYLGWINLEINLKVMYLEKPIHKIKRKTLLLKIYLRI